MPSNGFFGSPRSARPDDLTIRIAGCDLSFACPAANTVLQALAPVHRRRIASGCHGGGCGVCRVRIVRGTYRTAAMSRVHVPAQDEANGIALACRTWPASDLVVEPLGKLAVRHVTRTKLPIGAATPAHMEKH